MTNVIHLNYELHPRARVSAGRFAQVGNGREIHEIIPGTVVRGALGAAWWSASAGGFRPLDDRQLFFESLFRRAMRVNAALPAVHGDTEG